jgi:transcriptional regulator with XRE-family HTH domain
MNENIKSNIAHNLTELRKGKKLTQNELAEKFSYSDKAVSKWEHGEALPSIEVLQQLADFYGVSLDYLTHEITPANRKDFPSPNSAKVNKTVITALAVSLVWILAIVACIGSTLYYPALYWMAFVWAIPSLLPDHHHFQCDLGAEKIPRFLCHDVLLDAHHRHLSGVRSSISLIRKAGVYGCSFS